MTETNLIRLKLAVLAIQRARMVQCRDALLANEPALDLRTLATIPAIQLTDRKAKS